MRILLLSMPDSFEHTPSIAIRMPNGALASLAGNVDAHHEVAIADLVLAQSSVRRTIERLVAERRPDLVGLSVMTFQRATARRIIALVRALTPDVRIVVGGAILPDPVVGGLTTIPALVATLVAVTAAFAAVFVGAALALRLTELRSIVEIMIDAIRRPRRS